MTTPTISEPYTITDNLDELLAVLPDELARAISADERVRLIEIVLDLGRQPEARFLDGYKYLRERVVTSEELAHVEARLGAFGDDNRAGIPATLHRISAIRNRRGTVVGLTLRIGRAVSGIVDILRDLIAGGQSVLLMGRPGLGKTTLLREMARVMADEEGKRVVIVDTSNEIAGDGDVPHPAIGRARRMQVARVAQQHDVMIEAVENHMPEVIVIDEIGRVEEALAARTIAERGVQLIATVHGNTLDNLLVNPSMSDLIGGIGAVTLSDEEARRRGTQKTVLERKAPPTFDIVIEMIERDRIAVRRPIAEVVDALLRGQNPIPETRWRDENGEIQTQSAAPIEPPALRPERDKNNPREQRQPRDNRERDGRRDRFETRFGSREVRPRENRERDSRLREREDLPTRESGESGMRGTLTPETDEFERPAAALRLLDRDENEEENETDEKEELTGDWTNVNLDAARVRRVYPFGVSRSRLSRAVKQLGLNLTLTRSWQEADAVLALTGSGGVPEGSSLLREARELKLPIVGVKGNTYAQILARLNDIFSSAREGVGSPRELAMQEARNAVQRVLSGAEPVELRPQGKTMRRVQHQVAERYHLRSYSVGREPNRRVRFLPNIRG